MQALFLVGDLVEKRLKEKSEEFTKHFEQFYLKAVEMTGYLRTESHHFPALKKFTKDVSLELKLFSHFYMKWKSSSYLMKY